MKNVIKLIMIGIFLIPLAGCGVYRVNCDFPLKIQVHYGQNNNVKTFYCKKPEYIQFSYECIEVNSDREQVGGVKFVNFGDGQTVTTEPIEQCQPKPVPMPIPKKKKSEII